MSLEHVPATRIRGRWSQGPMGQPLRTQLPRARLKNKSKPYLS